MTNEEAIQYMRDMQRGKFQKYPLEQHEALELAIKALEKERPKGKWIKILPEKRGYADFFRCSVCLCNVHLGYWGKECWYNYCPNCGSIMEEGDEE